MANPAKPAVDVVALQEALDAIHTLEMARDDLEPADKVEMARVKSKLGHAERVFYRLARKHIGALLAVYQGDEDRRSARRALHELEARRRG